MAPKSFRPTCYKFYGQLDTLRPAPATAHHGTAALLLVLALILAAPAAYLLLTGDFPGSSLFYGLQEDSPIVTALLSVALRLF